MTFILIFIFRNVPLFRSHRFFTANLSWEIIYFKFKTAWLVMPLKFAFLMSKLPTSSSCFLQLCRSFIKIMSTLRRPNVGFGFYKLMDRRIYFAREPPVKPQFTFQIWAQYRHFSVLFQIPPFFYNWIGWGIIYF